ncbi:MAG: MATE family efflux transporter [Bacillota bacterium]|jgi:putative MATE family efflux protein
MPNSQPAALKQPVLDTDRIIRKQVMDLAWPVMAESVLQTFAQIVSMALVGHLGANAVASIGLSMQPLNLFYGVFMGAGVAATAVVARLKGAGQKQDAARAAAQSIMLSVIIATLGALLIATRAEQIVVWMGAEPGVVKEGTRYLLVMTPGLFCMWISTVLTGALRGVGDTRTPMKVNIVISIINFAGNIVLVYGMLGFPAMGVLGAGIATSTARLAGAILLFIPYLSGKTLLPVNLRQDFKWDSPLIKRLARVGIPGIMERLLMSTAFLFYTRMIAGLGSTSYAAHAIGVNAESLSYMPAQAFSIAATTLVGQYLGSRQPELAEKSTWQSLKMACLLVGTLALVFGFFPGVLMQFYTSDPEVIHLGGIYLQIMALCQIPQAFSWVFLGAMRGAGDTRISMLVTAFSAWVVRLGLTYTFINILHTDVTGAWWAMGADGLFKGIAGFIWFRSGYWKKSVA